MQSELIYNPHGGQVVLRHELREVVAFLGRHGWTITVRETSKPMEATELAREAVRRGAKVVIAAGGDGTVNEVANGLFGTDAALGVLPVGTTNAWALQMGIPTLNPMSPGSNVVKFVSNLQERIARPLPANYYRKVLLDAARVLVEGRIVAVDIGEVSGRYFLMWAGIGLDAATIKSTSLKGKKALGSWAYLLPILETVRRYPSTDVCLKLDGKETKVRTSQIVVCNIQLYGGFLAIGAEARVNDGKLDVCVFKGGGFLTFVRHALKVLSHQQLRDSNMEYYQSSEIVVESARPLPVQVDGEPLTETPITIRAISSALKVIVPRNAPENLFHR
ncbi:MAG: diacylglycerol kinase family lipid kinase [Chloroflexi bacterium]|nr:diacylglycerol kinase family lipid kinase [Chloroflexota bacterium]